MILYPTPDYYIQNLITMQSPQARRLWRQAIKEHFDCTCVYCGETYELHKLTIDHVRPRSSGGQDITSNLVASCRRCNQEKGSRNWRQWMRETFGFKPDREQLILSHIS